MQLLTAKFLSSKLMGACTVVNMRKEPGTSYFQLRNPKFTVMTARAPKRKAEGAAVGAEMRGSPRHSDSPTNVAFPLGSYASLFLTEPALPPPPPLLRVAARRAMMMRRCFWLHPLRCT